jgi:putative hemolysin
MGTDPDPGAAIFVQILWLLVLVLINAFFSMSEVAVISLNATKMERMAAEGHRRARHILKLTKDSSRFLSMIQLGVTLAGFLASATVAREFGEPLRRLLETVLPPSLQSVLDAAVTFILTLLLSYVTMVLGELVPKRLAMRHAEQIAMRAVGILGACAVALRPLAWIASASANGVLRLIGFDPHAESAAVTEEEIRMLVDAGGERGVIEEAQQEMINNIFEFDDMDVSDIMTHRTDIVGIAADQPLACVVEASIAEGVSRIPVFEDDLDAIIGVVYIKDLLKYIGTSLPGQGLRDVMREAYYVPETKRCGELFKEMTAKRIQIAIVVDEYGGTAGLVSLEDVLEAIVGNIRDEYDNEEEEISKIDESTFLLEGTTDIEEVGELAGIALPEGEYDTIAGFVISQLGYLPRAGEHPVVEYGRLRFTVEAVEEKRISSIKLFVSGLAEQ